MPYPREILNRLKWKDGSLNGVRVTFVHRGAPGNTLTIPAEEISLLGRSFFSTADSEIPYHRIVLIERGGEVLFDIREFKNKDAGTT
ncbi:MAG: RNA repair domain-containing protein [Methanomassiliicoccales archaeon]